MASDEMQVHLTARNDLERELINTTKRIQKMEAELRDLGDAQSPEAERRIRKLDTQLDKAYRSSKTLKGAVDNLDDKIDQMGNSARVAGNRMSGLDRDIDKTHRTSKSFIGGWGKMLGVIAGVTAAIGAASGAWRFLSSSIDEARQARKAAAQTFAVLKSMGRAEKPKALEAMIDQMEAASGIDGDNIREMTNILLTFGNVTDDTFTKANKLALDLSVAFGKDLTSSAVMVGKALNDPTKGLTALTRVGVSFTAQQQEQVKAMMEVGDIAGAQQIILHELTRQVKGSAEEQADWIDKLGVAWGNLKESVGDVLVSGVAEVMDALFPDTKNQKSPLVGFSKWLKQHQGEMVRGILLVARSLVGLAQSFANASHAMGTFLAWRLRIKAWTDIGITWDQHNAMLAEADAIDERNRKLEEGTEFLQDWLDRLDASATALDWQNKRVKELRDTIAGIKDKEVKIKIRATMKDVYQTVTDAVQAAQAAADAATNGGDTTTGMGVGSLGAAGLAAYHGAYSSALGGHSILSGIRSTNLGSIHSDHRHGRAMDIQGPRLGSYAQVVRRNGGYAAMHGTGGNRHLHVVPRTRRPAPVASGGNTFHADVTVNNPRHEMDIQSAVSRGLRDAARQDRERR